MGVEATTTDLLKTLEEVVVEEVSYLNNFFIRDNALKCRQRLYDPLALKRHDIEESGFLF